MSRKVLCTVIESIFVILYLTCLSHAEGLLYGINIGASQKADPRNNCWKMGVSIEGKLFYTLTSHILLGTSITYNRWSVDDQMVNELSLPQFDPYSPAPIVNEARGSWGYIELLPSLRVSVPINTAGNVNIFGQLGMGASKVINGSVTLIDMNDNSYRYHDDQLQFALNLGGGLIIGRWGRTYFEVSALYHFADTDYNIANYIASNDKYYSITIGFLHGLHKKTSDADKQRIQVPELEPEQHVTGELKTPESRDAVQQESASAVDVDVDIPTSRTKKPYAIAVVIGNRDYEENVPVVEYALRDAEIIRDYLIKTLGYQEGNVIYRTDATFAELRDIFGTVDDPNGTLYNWVKPHRSDVFVYYSGHGAPDRNSNKPYILPVDCNPDNVKMNAYPLDLLYTNLSKVRAKSVTVVIDACFSGESDKGLIDRDLSAVAIEVTDPAVMLSNWNGIVFTSTDNRYPSCWYHEKRHSLFTYFFLKALQGAGDSDGDGKLTVGEIFNYVSDDAEGVPYYSKRLKGFTQKPCLIGEDRSRIIIEY